MPLGRSIRCSQVNGPLMECRRSSRSGETAGLAHNSWATNARTSQVESRVSQVQSIAPGLGFAFLFVVGTTGCTAHAQPNDVGQHRASASATNSPSKDSSSSNQPAPPAVPNPVPAEGEVPDGLLVTGRAGRGPGSIELDSSVGTGSRVTVRFSCVGDGPVSLTDRRGGPLINIAGCSRFAVYGTEFPGSPDDRTLRLSVGKAAQWRIAVWVAGS